jgi:hypothetical protein
MRGPVPSFPAWRKGGMARCENRDCRAPLAMTSLVDFGIPPACQQAGGPRRGMTILRNSENTTLNWQRGNGVRA